MLRYIIFITFFLIVSFANDIEKKYENDVIDKFHEQISTKVEDIASLTDILISNLICCDQNISEINKVKSIDELFQNEKHIQETKKSFIKFSTNYEYNSLSKNNFDIKVSAKLPLSKSKKNIKLFIFNFNQDNINSLIKKNEKENAEIGVSLFDKVSNNTDIKYSVGLRSLNLFTRARFAYKTTIFDFDFEPIQTFEYSIKDNFKEYTNIYFDKKIEKDFVFRIEFNRGTGEDLSGMNYSSAIHLYWMIDTVTGLQLTQGFYGNTKFQYTYLEETKKYNGINNYLSQITFRKNIYKNWLFYEINSGVNFHIEHDYEPNYKFLIKLDAFFGKE